MINFVNYKKTFTEASASEQGKVLVRSDKVVFKFDDYIKDNYTGICGIDAIYDFKYNGAINRCFLEFKTGSNYKVSHVMEQVLSSLIIYFKDVEALNICFKKYCFYLVICNNRRRVLDGIKKVSVRNEIGSAKNRDENFQVLFEKLKKIFFLDAGFKTGDEIVEMLEQQL